MIGPSGWPEPDRSQQASHDGKVVFLFLGQARLAALKMERRHGQRYEAYDCEFGVQGKHWHVGTPPGEGIIRVRGPKQPEKPRKSKKPWIPRRPNPPRRTK